VPAVAFGVGPRRLSLVLAVTLALLGLGAATATGAPHGRTTAKSAPVKKCPVPNAQLQGLSVTPPPIPTSVPLPADAVAANTTVFGTGLPGDTVYYGLAPNGFRCAPSYANADGGFFMTLSDPAVAGTRLDYAFSA
jgi:hypothetical protein